MNSNIRAFFDYKCEQMFAVHTVNQPQQQQSQQFLWVVESPKVRAATIPTAKWNGLLGEIAPPHKIVFGLLRSRVSKMRTSGQQICPAQMKQKLGSKSRGAKKCGEQQSTIENGRERTHGKSSHEKSLVQRHWVDFYFLQPNFLHLSSKFHSAQQKGPIQQHSRQKLCGLR
jgi:hypothetical protein